MPVLAEAIKLLCVLAPINVKTTIDVKTNINVKSLSSKSENAENENLLTV